MHPGAHRAPCHQFPFHKCQRVHVPIHIPRHQCLVGICQYIQTMSVRGATRKKYFDPNLIPGTYTQNPYIQRTQSPRTLMLQNMNNRNIQNCSHAQSPRGTPHVNYQYSQPIRGTPNSNYSASQKGSSNPNRSSHSDTEGNSMPCFQSYRITPQGEKDRITHSEKDYRIANSEKDYRLANSEMDYRLGREPHWVPNQDYRFFK